MYMHAHAFVPVAQCHINFGHTHIHFGNTGDTLMSVLGKKGQLNSGIYFSLANNIFNSNITPKIFGTGLRTKLGK